MNYVYISSDKWRHKFLVGFYLPGGCFEEHSHHDERQDAADMVAWLNGGLPRHVVDAIKDAAVFYLEQGA